MLTLSGSGQGQNGKPLFEFTIKTDNPGSASTQFVIPTTGSGYLYDISTNDGQSVKGITGNYTLNFENPGEYQIKISGDFPRIYFNGSGDKRKLIDIKSWGDIEWTSMDSAFMGCTELSELSCIDVPNLKFCTSTRRMFRDCSNFIGYDKMNNWDMYSITNTSGMFYACTPFNQPLGDWDVSNVTFLSGLYDGIFQGTSFNQNIESWDVSNVVTLIQPFAGTQFNQPLNNWNVSSVVYFGSPTGNADSYFGTAFNQPLDKWDMSSALCTRGLFRNASSFNQDISMWDMSNVTDIRIMFSNATSFNQPLNDWDLSSLTLTNGNFQGGVFSGATSFNQDLDNWDMSRVTDISKMFMDATSFNGSINAWDTSNVTNMSEVFWRRYGGMTFNQPLDNWDVRNVTNMASMFSGASYFDQNIGGWDVGSVTNMTQMFSSYTSGRPVFNNGGSSSIENWDTRNVTTMSGMFGWGSSGFDRSMANWNIEKVTNLYQFLVRNFSFSRDSYDATLVGWASQTPQNNINTDFGNTQYSYEGRAAKQSLIENFGWTIVDGGEAVRDEFVFTVKTDNAGTSASNQFTTPWIGTYDIDWGDNVVESAVVDTQTHTYSTAGTYDVKVTAVSGRILFNGTGDRLKLLDIKNWGSCAWTTMEKAFKGCENLSKMSASDSPNLSSVTSMSNTFIDVPLEVNLNNWDVSNVSNFGYMAYASYQKVGFNYNLK